MTIKMILPLFTTSLFFIGTQALQSAEETRKDQETGAPTLRATSPTTDDRDTTRSWIDMEYAVAKKLPKNERDLDALISNVDGPWDPEAPIDFNGHQQRIIYVSILENKLNKLMAKISQDPLLRGESLPPLLSSSLPLPSPMEVPLQEDKYPMPIYDADHFKKYGIPEQMIRFCFDIAYTNLVKIVGGRMDDVNVDMLTQSLLYHSTQHKKGWPEEVLKRIAGHIVDFDDLEEQDAQKDANKGDSDKR